MAFLTLGGVTIPVLIDEPEGVRVEIGARERAFDGGPRSSVRSRKWEWPIVTRIVPEATGATILAALEGSPPIAATGDLTGSIDVIVGDVRQRWSKKADGEYVQLSFLMQEA